MFLSNIIPFPRLFLFPCSFCLILLLLIFHCKFCTPHHDSSISHLSSCPLFYFPREYPYSYPHSHHALFTHFQFLCLTQDSGHDDRCPAGACSYPAFFSNSLASLLPLFLPDPFLTFDFAQLQWSSHLIMPSCYFPSLTLIHTLSLNLFSLRILAMMTDAQLERYEAFRRSTLAKTKMKKVEGF